ncbi:FtsB family cell division protein [Sutcliffiella cohnii]
MSTANNDKVSQIRSQYYQQLEEEQQKKSKKRRGLYMRLAVFFTFALIVAGFIGKAFYNQHVVLNDKLEQKEVLEQKLSQLQKEQQHLEDEIVKLNDDEYILKIARRDYFMSEKGEIIFNIPKQKDRDTSSY